MWTPVPFGVVGVIRFVGSSDIETWKYELSVTADLIMVPYSTDLDNWKSFLNHPASAKTPYGDLKLDFVADSHITLKSTEFKLDMKDDYIPINGDTMLGLLRTFAPNEDGQVSWDLQKINLSERGKDNFIISYRFIEPPIQADESLKRKWNSILSRDHPYNDSFYQEEGISKIGSISTLSTNDSLEYSLFIGIEGNHDQDYMESKLKELNASLIYY